MSEFSTLRTESACCTNCGTHFKRHPAETWKTLCMKCWRWHQARKRIEAAHKFLQGV